MDNQQFTTAPNPVYQESQEKNAKWLWLLIALIVIGALIFAFVRGIGPFGALRSKGETEVSPSPAALFASSPSPEVSPAPQLDKSTVSIRVLNGSGKAGVASTMKTFLESKGYKVSAVGNAANYDFAQTFLRFKEAFRKYQDVLLSDLSDNYSVVISEDNLEATDSADIEVIVGAK